MKTITHHERDLILDVRNEGLTTLPSGILEKDLLITEVLRTISAFESEAVQLVFCGGTSLAKAHGIVDRMSEDVDFKVLVPNDLSRSARSKLLSGVKRGLVLQFELAGFSVPQEELIALNENSYVSMNLKYESLFEQVASLRTEIKVELTANRPKLPPTRVPITTLLDSFAQQPAGELAFDCVDVRETLAEKMVSFLRRRAALLSGNNRSAYDDRLVRHLYDVRAIVRRLPELTPPHELFGEIVAGDASQFKNQFPDFDSDPIGQMRLALESLTTDSDSVEADYISFVSDLVFGDQVSFTEARDAFSEFAAQLLDGLESRTGA
jgi:predicted nucleotidyltransferase component of viral defense system